MDRMEEAGWNSRKATGKARLRNHITVPFPLGKVCTIPLTVCVELLLTILRTSSRVGIKKKVLTPVQRHEGQTTLPLSEGIGK